MAKWLKSINASSAETTRLGKLTAQRMGLCWSSHSNSFSAYHYDPILEAQWKALPDYVMEGHQNVLIMADTSGAMMGRPLATALGLAIYFAERTTGAFKDTFMTFSDQPKLIKLKGDTLYDKLQCIPSIYANTNLEAAFELILKVAIYLWRNFTLFSIQNSIIKHIFYFCLFMY